ncbi:DUF2293 domain-containing protein [Pseudonocardia endophytica]|uniref:DUF2293 domain-containing protein n=1 Tax=Pseudonocardia endophytica TaxID=401976 RepID=A0A4R1HMR2_PSEEN|nr:DUF2293 domain-containing protein [Pseudonocardia endophytica]TCK21855.1 hypothetical protein EV378_5847 [Pseudonocardia endophytica]
MPSLQNRVRTAAEQALAASGVVTPCDVLCGLGWVAPPNVERWRSGRMPHLASVLPVPLERVTSVLDVAGRWAAERGLQAVEGEQLTVGRDRRPLRFAEDGPPALELAMRTHWLSPDLTAAKRDRVVEKQNKTPDLIVVEPVFAFTCVGCGADEGLFTEEERGPVCLTCADLDHLVFLPSGDATLTRRARAQSTLSAVVVRWNRRRKRNERRGALVEVDALERAEASLLTDADARARQRERARERAVRQDAELVERMTARIGELFPGCPADRARAIADHTALRGSGRVGRSAAGRALDDDALAAAVVASVRHEDTDYDAMLAAGVAREDARDRIRAGVDAVLDGWR